jgi:hypothetical protein
MRVEPINAGRADQVNPTLAWAARDLVIHAPADRPVMDGRVGLSAGGRPRMNQKFVARMERSGMRVEPIGVNPGFRYASPGYACYAQTMVRLIACEKGHSIPPLNC